MPGGAGQRPTRRASPALPARFSTALFATVLAIGASGCSTTSTTSTKTPTASDTAAPNTPKSSTSKSTTASGTDPADASNPLPAVPVTDVRSGKTVNLAAALSGKKPLLVWFWAPY